MSILSDTLGKWQAGPKSTQGGAGSGMPYKAATVGLDQSYTGGPKNLDKLAQFGAEAYGQYKTKKTQRADERSNEIIRKLTPEQRREAINNGTLLYQDDPYAMQALREKTGRNAAFQIDDEVSQKVKNGEFRTRAEMDAYRHKRLTEGAKSFAEMFGIKEADVDYQRGLNSNITERNISLYGLHDNFVSDQAQKGALMNSKLELNAVLSDPTMLARPDSSQFFEAYINQGLSTGSLASDNQAQQVIMSSINDAVQRPGSTAFLLGLENRKVTLNGTTTTYKDLFGDEQWNALKVKSQHSQFQNDAKMTEKFRLDINSALNSADSTAGWEQLQALKAQLDLRQPGEEMTPEREMLIQAQEQAQTRFAQQSAKLATEMDKQKKTMNKSNVIDQQFQKRINGQYVSTSYKDMPTNENTGEFTHSDMVNYANSKLSEIESMDITEQQKDSMKLSYLRADSKDGAFRTAVGQLVGDAGSEWSAAVVNGRLANETPAMQSLRRLRNTDPNLFASLYPDQAELFLTLDMMDSQGIDPQVLIDADRSRRNLTKEMQYEDDKAWAALKNNSQSPELSRMPASVDGFARKIYDSVKYRTGNSDMAMQQVDKYLKESTTTFTGEDVDGETIGVIPKNSLQVTDDPRSWQQGRDIVDAARQQIIAKNPWVTNKQLSVYQQGDSIIMMDTTGTIRIVYDRELLSKVYQDNQQKVQAAAEKKALEEANKRAPITAATKARKELGDRARRKAKKVPKYIYGSDNK